MTITVQPARNELTANAGQQIFNYTFKIFSITDLNVYITPAGQDANDSTDLTTAYTVLGVGDEDGGTITLTVGATLNDLVTIVSNIPSSRTTDYQNNGDFRPPVVNDDFDRVVSIAKKVEDLTNRALLIQQSQQGPKPLTLPAPASEQLLRWKGDLSGIENVTLAELDPELISEDSVTFTFKTVAAMQGSAEIFPIGKRIFWQGYYAESDGGSNWGTVKSGAHTDDGGSIFTLADGKFVQANIKNKVGAQKYGVTFGAAAANDTQFQKALDFGFANGLPIKFGAGDFDFSAQHEYGGQGIEGVGRVNTKINVTFAGTFLKNIFREHKHPIKNIAFEGDGGTGSGLAGSVFLGSDGADVGLFRLLTKNIQVSGFEQCFELDKTLSCEFSATFISRCTTGFFFIGGGAGWNNTWHNNNITFNNCKFDNCSDVGVDYVGAGLSFTGSSVCESSGGGLRIARDVSNTRVNSIANLYFEFNTNFDIELKDANVTLGPTLHQAGGGGTSPLVCISADNCRIAWTGRPQYLDGGGVKRTDFTNGTQVTAVFSDFESNRDFTDATSEVFYLTNRTADKRLQQTFTDLDTAPVTLAAPIGTSTRYTNHVIAWMVEAPNGEYTGFTTYGRLRGGSFKTEVVGPVTQVNENTFTFNLGTGVYTFKTSGGAGTMTIESSVTETGDTIVTTRVVNSRAEPVF